MRDSIGLSEAQATISNLQQAVVERDHMVQGMYAHVQELRDEVNRLTQSVLPPSNSMVDDLVRMCTIDNSYIDIYNYRND